MYFILIARANEQMKRKQSKSMCVFVLSKKISAVRDVGIFYFLNIFINPLDNLLS